MAAKKKEAKVSKFQRSQIETAALRDYVPKDMRPLFDHLLSLAKHSHSVGYPKRAGQELAHARKLAKRPPEEVKVRGGMPGIPFELERVKLNRQGYDAQGRYFGVGQPLFTATNPSNDDRVQFRAASTGAARKLVREHLRRYAGFHELRQSGGTSTSPIAGG